MHPTHRLVLILLTAASALIAAAAVSSQADEPARPAPPASSPASPPSGSPQTHPQTSLDDPLESKIRVICVKVAELMRDFHGGKNWRQAGAIQCQLKVRMGESTVIDGVLLYDPTRGRARLDLADGPHLFHDGKKTWITPASSTIDARGELTLWPWMITAPLRMADRGVELSAYRQAPLQGLMYDSFKATFNPDGGDNPNERYMAFIDRKIHMLRALGYWPRAKPGDSNPPESRLAVYDDYVNLGGVKLPTSWTFYKWREIESVEGDSIGRGTIKNLRFAQPNDGDFTPPADAREITPPANP